PYPVAQRDLPLEWRARAAADEAQSRADQHGTRPDYRRAGAGAGLVRGLDRRRWARRVGDRAAVAGQPASPAQQRGGDAAHGRLFRRVLEHVLRPLRPDADRAIEGPLAALGGEPGRASTVEARELATF